MKTWRQLEAMAKRQGRSMDRRSRFVAINGANRAVEQSVVVYSFCSDAKLSDRILRAMVEAALEVGR